MNDRMRLLVFMVVVIVSLVVDDVNGFSGGISPPVLGLGAILFRPKGTTFRPSLGDRNELLKAGEFFTDAFWGSKVKGKNKGLSPAQKKTLMKQQQAEFARRYGSRNGYTNPNDRRAELIVCENSNDETMGCVGIEVDTISDPNTVLLDSYYSNMNDSSIQAPLMSNLAVGNQFRRKGLAEDLVKEAEQLARKSWGYTECYLLVEKNNMAAVKLYRKLGYKTVWEDKNAKTLTPTESGAIRTTGTIILCMKKRLDAGIFGRFLPN